MEAPGVSLMFYGRSTSVISHLPRTYDTVHSNLVPASTFLSSALSSPPSVRCCVSCVAMIYTQPRVASDSTKHMLEGKSSVVEWITVHTLLSSLLSCILLVVHV